MSTFKKAAVITTLLSLIGTTAFAQDSLSKRYIIKYKSGDKDFVASQIKQSTGEIILSVERYNLFAAMLSDDERARLNSLSEVDYIEIDPERRLMAETTPFGITMVEAPLVSETLLTPRKVCVIDTGYNLGHTDLPNIGVTGDNVLYSNGTLAGYWYNDPLGHGTRVAGIITAIGGNNQGVTGVNPSGALPLHIVRVFSDQGIFFGSDSIAALDKCQNVGANIVNMSYGGPVFSQAENQAFIAAGQSGVLMIAASGNDGAEMPNYPATLDAVMSVGGVDDMGVHDPQATIHNSIEISAPSVNILSTEPNNQYGVDTGTSYATPYVAGVAALVWGHYPSCSGYQIRLALGNTAEDKGTPGWDKYYGKGIVKAKAAFDALAINGCTVPSIAPQIQNGVTVPNQIAAAGTQLEFTMDVKATANIISTSKNMSPNSAKPLQALTGLSDLSFTLSNGTGNADLYVRYGAKPTLTNYDCRSNGSTSDEVCEFPNPQDGTYYVLVHGETAFYGVDLKGSYTDNGPVNQSPIANFTYRCDELFCIFDGRQSSDSDGQILSYNWDYGDDNTNTGIGSAHSFTSAGTYNVTLTVTDDDNLSNSVILPVEVTDTQASPISLSASTRVRRRKNVSTLRWSGATTRRVDIYVNGEFYKRARNNGKARHKTPRGTATYSYQICNATSSTHCSDNVVVTYTR